MVTKYKNISKICLFSIVILGQITPLMQVKSDSLTAGGETIVNNQSERSDVSTWMPDESLQTQVAKALGKDVNDLVPTDLKALTSLNLQGVSDVTGLEYAVNLTKLDIDFCETIDVKQLSEMPFAINLTDLSLSYSTLENADSLNDFASVEQLVLMDDGLTEVPELNQLTQLITLTLMNNKISNISSIKDYQFSNLYTLNLSHNTINNIEGLADFIANNKSLESVFLENNNIYDFSSLYSSIWADRTLIIPAYDQVVELPPVVLNGTTQEAGVKTVNGVDITFSGLSGQNDESGEYRENSIIWTNLADSGTLSGSWDSDYQVNGTRELMFSGTLD